MAYSKGRLTATAVAAPQVEDETCEVCHKVSAEVVLILKSGSRKRNDHMLQMAHPSCLRRLIDKALAAT